MSVLFVANEAGAARWMAAVWPRITEQAVVALSDTAWRHLERLGLWVPPMPLKFDGELAAYIASGRCQRVIASATGSDMEQRVVETCRATSTPVTQVVDTWGGYGMRFGRAVPDWVAVIDEVAEEECRAQGGPNCAYLVAGQPAWECVERLPPANPASVAFIGQPIAELYGHSLGYDEKGTAGQIAALAGRRPDLIANLIYLLHPSEVSAPSELTVTEDASTVLGRCGTIVGMFSSMLIDAALAGRRVIVFQPAADLDMFGPSRHGLLRRVTSIEDLEYELEHGVPAAVDELRHKVDGSIERVLEHLGCEA